MVSDWREEAFRFLREKHQEVSFTLFRLVTPMPPQYSVYYQLLFHSTLCCKLNCGEMQCDPDAPLLWSA